MGGGGTERREPEKIYYYGEAGRWDRYEWSGVERVCFVFKDTLEVGGTLDAGDGEGYMYVNADWSAAKNAEKLSRPSYSLASSA
eukprot:SAG22_NODE_2894_length_2119_cov_2.617327_2_plen_84_part_00